MVVIDLEIKCDTSTTNGPLWVLDKKWHNNIPSVIPRLGSAEGGVYARLPLPCEGIEIVSNRPILAEDDDVEFTIEKESTYI